MSAEKRTNRINVLDKHVAELIAAGEVVERPASVVKELVENAIDADAKNILVSVSKGGIALMQITDDGCGIEHMDVPLAFLRHATSKISDQDDLFSIATLGFRGEALASVASVARVNLFTRVRGDDFGTHYRIEGGEEIEYEEAGCAEGTTIIVEDLFFNTPARMKFLKKDASEATAAAGVVEKIALSHPEISFRFIKDGKEMLHTPGDGDLKSAIYTVLGKEFAASLIPVDYTLGGIKVTGFITKPTFSRGSRGMQYFYINGRYIKSGTIMTALENGYKNSIMVGKFPGAVLNVEIPPQQVDVNVHPAKMEVKFSDDRPVFGAVYNAVKTALSKNDTSSIMKLNDGMKKHGILDAVEIEGDSYPAHNTAGFSSAASLNSVMADFADKSDSETAIDITSQRRLFAENSHAGDSETHKLCGSDTYSTNSGVYSSRSGGYRKNIDIFVDDDIPYKKFGCNADKAADESANDEGDIGEGKSDFADLSEKSGLAAPASDTANSLDKNGKDADISKADYPAFYNEADPEPRFLGEAFSTYIIVEYGDNIVFVDKHASHERIIFERLKSSMSTSPQLLISPVVVKLGNDDYNAMLENLDAVGEAGFEIEDFGQGSVAVRSIPPFLDEKDIEGVVTEMADKFRYSSMPSSDKIDWIYHTVSCKAAIRAGDISSERELMELVKKVVVEKSIKFCPHGRPTAFVLTRKELEKQFKRIV
ncbi:MAG TPA: DNA mismatch repair endonuclease MutL [Firmicutes bacterium]|nr:DNA mismatch repair endonuclease MutL [Bacillota bacterium]